MMLPNSWSIESAKELALALIAANHVNMAIKAAKVYVRKDGKNTMAAIEMFVKPPENFRLVLQRALRAADNFAKLMQEGRR